MVERAHPSHKRISLITIGVGFIFLLISFSAGFYYTKNIPDVSQLKILFAVLFIIFVTAFIFIVFLFSHISKCPECRSLIQRQKYIGRDDEYIRFVCN
jgi:uncharacterized membrane protein (DUF485 family)